MSREQILTPDRVDARTDVYALGVVLYHALTGEIPFRGTLLGVLKQVLEDDPVPPRRLNDAIARDLETICLKCLEKDFQQRYPSTAALSDDLQGHLAGRPIQAKRPGIVRGGTRWARHHPAWAAMFIVSMMLLSSSGVVGFISAAHARAEAKSADELRLSAEARAAAEHREVQIQQHEAQTQKREVLIQQMQRVRLAFQRNGWSSAAWDLARHASAITSDTRLQSEAAAILIGLDARKRKSFPLPGTGLAFDPKGGRLMISGSSSARRGPELPAHIWDRTTDQLQIIKLMGQGAFGFGVDGTPVLLKIPRDEPSSAQLVDVTTSHVLRTFKSAVQGISVITGYALTPNGKWIVASSRNLNEKGEHAPTGTIVVWEAATGREIFRTTAQQATDVALAPDGSLLAAGHEDGQISVWSLPKGEPIATLKADRNRIHCLVFGRDPVSRSGPRSSGRGWLLASGDAGGGVVVWDLRMKVPRSICQGPTNTSEILTLAFSPDGMTLSSAGRGSVKLWDIASGKFLIDVDAGNYVRALAFSPDGRQLAAGSVAGFGAPDSVNVWDLELARGISSLRGLSRSAFRSTFSSDGSLVAALSSDWHVGIWDRAAQRLLHVLEVTPGSHADNAALAFSPDGHRFAFSAGDEASLWDVATGELVKTWVLPEGLVDLLAFPEANRLLLFRTETEAGDVGPFGPVSTLKDHRVCRVRDLFSPEPLKPLAAIRDCNLHVFSADCSPDGKYYAIEGKGDSAGKRTRIANLYEGPTGKKLGTLPTQSSINLNGASFNFDTTGTVLCFRSVAKEDHSYLLEMPSRAVLSQFDEFPECLGPYAKRWLMLSDANTDQPAALTLFEQDHQAPLIKFILDLGNTTGIARPQFSPDGLHLVWGNPSGTVTVVDLVEVQRRLAEIGLGW